MQKIGFTKMVASGNDFVILSRKPRQGLGALAKAVCERKFGVGADGLLLLERTGRDIRMRIFNADGSEAEMCGNGARCAAFWARNEGGVAKPVINLKTKAGLIGSRILGDQVRIKLTAPRDLKLDFRVKVNQRNLHLSFINTGVPHAVIFSEGVDRIDVPILGRLVRYQRAFLPAGTNVDFVEPLNRNSIKIRTYERGVEDETLACGTGSAAAALIFALKGNVDRVVNVHTKSGEVLRVYFERTGRTFKNIWLQGRVRIVYRGEYYV